MKMSRRSRREWRIILWVLMASAAISAWFGIKVGPENDPMLRSAIHGIVTSLVIATPIVIVQLKADSWAPLRRLRRLPLAVYFALKTLFYAAMIIGGLIVARIILGDDVRLDQTFRQAIVFSIAMAVVGNLFFEFGGLLGLGTLRNLLTGRYVQPRTEQRTFLLIDMKDSTGLAERLGPVLFHELLNDFFRDVSDAALECNAEIHKYVGDEAILTWLGTAGLGDGTALSCSFLARDVIASHRARYVDRFGAVPDYRAALHCGAVVAGEIGDVRREIAFVGDTLNVAARLLDASKAIGRDILVSVELLGRSKLPDGVRAEALPTLAVRGRVEPLAIAALDRISAAP